MKFRFYILTLIAAIALEVFAAYYSIYGLSALLGRNWAIIGMAIAVEFGKVITVSYAYNWLKKTIQPWKTLVVILLVGAIFITSIGIYGYLINSFQERQGKVFDVNTVKTKFNNENAVLIQSEISMYKEQVELAKNRLKSLNESRALQEKRLSDSMTTLNFKFIDKMRSDIAQANTDINETNKTITDLIGKMQQKNIEMSKLQQDNFNIENTNTDVDVGPLRFIANVFNKKMSDIVGFIIMILMFLLDPFAITLFIVTNLQIAAHKKPIVVEQPIKREYKKKQKTVLEKMLD